MSWLYSQALVEEYLVENFLDGEQSAPLSGSSTPQAYCAPDKMMGFSRLSRFGMTYKPLTGSRGEELLTLYLAVFHAKTLVPQEKAQELMGSEAECGEKWRASFTKYDPSMRLWKTHQCSLQGDLEPFSETWPQWGLMRDGECWEQVTLEQTTRGTESGLSQEIEKFPTPQVADAKSSKIQKGFQQNLTHYIHKTKFPTPTSHNSKEGAYPAEYTRKTPSLATHAGGKLNPMWVEWLMGWLLGWTDLKPLEMDKSHSAPLPHGKF